MRGLGLFAIWLIVVIGATTVTWQIVSAADNQVSDRPIAPLNVAAPVLTNTSSTTTTMSGPMTGPGVTTTTEPGTSGSPPTSNGPTTTTSPAASVWASRSIQTAGGTVIVRYAPGQVQYQSATPAPGFQVEIDDPGPPDVKVEFESESQKFEVSARWGDGGLEVETSSSSDD